MPRRVRHRAPRPRPPSALRQEQGRHPDREPHRRPPHHQGRNTGRIVPAGSARAQSRGVRDGRLRRHRPRTDAAREPRGSSSPTTSPRATSTPPAACTPKTAGGDRTSCSAYGGEIIFTPGDIVYSSIALDRDSRRPTIALEKLLVLMERRGHRPSIACAGSLDKMRGQAGARGRRHHRRQLHPCAMIGGRPRRRRMSVLFERKRRLHRRRRRSSPSICAPPAPRSRSRRCSATTRLKDFVLAGSRRSRRRVPADHRPDAADDQQERDRRAAATACSRSTRSTTARSPTSSAEQIDAQRRRAHRPMRSSVQRFPPRHLQPPHHPGVDRRHSRRRVSRRRQPGREPLGQHHRVQGLRPASRRTSARRASRSPTRTPACARSPRSCTTTPTARLLILKLGDRGVLTCRSGKDHESLDSFFVVDSFADRLVDAVGAGDALLAYATLAMLADGTTPSRRILGSMAAALRVRSATATFRSTPDDVHGQDRRGRARTLDYA